MIYALKRKKKNSKLILRALFFENTNVITSEKICSICFAIVFLKPKKKSIINASTVWQKLAIVLFYLNTMTPFSIETQSHYLGGAKNIFIERLINEIPSQYRTIFYSFFCIYLCIKCFPSIIHFINSYIKSVFVNVEIYLNKNKIK